MNGAANKILPRSLVRYLVVARTGWSYTEYEKQPDRMIKEFFEIEEIRYNIESQRNNDKNKGKTKQ